MHSEIATLLIYQRFISVDMRSSQNQIVGRECEGQPSSEERNPQTILDQWLSNLCLKTSSDGAPRTSVQLCYCLTVVIVKKFLFSLNMDLPLWNFHPYPTARSFGSKSRPFFSVKAFQVFEVLAAFFSLQKNPGITRSLPPPIASFIVTCNRKWQLNQLHSVIQVLDVIRTDTCLKPMETE